jgi:hypothetical protein
MVLFELKGQMKLFFRGNPYFHGVEGRTQLQLKLWFMVIFDNQKEIS